MDKRKVYAASFLKDLSNLLDHYGVTLYAEEGALNPRILIYSCGTTEEPIATKYVVRAKDRLGNAEADALASDQLNGLKLEDCEQVKQAYQADPGSVPYTVTSKPGQGGYHYYGGMGIPPMEPGCASRHSSADAP